MPDDYRYPLMINGVAVVSAPAEIDIVNAEQLRTVLLEAGKRGHARVVLDMTGTRFCDSEGFSVLAAVHKWALAEGGGLQLVIPADSPVLRIFRAIGLGASSPGSPAWNRPCPRDLPPPSGVPEPQTARAARTWASPRANGLRAFRTATDAYQRAALQNERAAAAGCGDKDQHERQAARHRTAAAAAA